MTQITSSKHTDHIIFHIDVNSAYLSWSAVRLLSEGSEIDLREIPSIIGGNREERHGIVVAKSIPAKKFGIITGEPIVDALKKCPSLLIEKPDHTYYKQKSKELIHFLHTYTTAIEQVSIDECYLDYQTISYLFSSPEEAAREIREHIYEKFGYTVNIGISDRKVLAKMASDFQKPNRVHTLYSSEIQKKMWPLPIAELFMCGKSSAKKLQYLGIQTIGELAQSDPGLLEFHLKKQGRMLYDYANGIDPSMVNVTPSRAKGIGNSTTLSYDLSKREEVLPVLSSLCKTISHRLKKEDLLAGSICTEIKYASFQTVSHQCPLITTTNQYEILYENAISLFDELWTGAPIRLLGVRTTKLCDSTAPVQLSFLDYEKAKPQIEKQKKLETALQKIRSKYGEDAIHKGQS